MGQAAIVSMLSLFAKTDAPKIDSPVAASVNIELSNQFHT